MWESGFPHICKEGIPPDNAPRPRIRDASTLSNCSDAIIEAIAEACLGVY